MTGRRVVVTGAGIASPIGNSLAEVTAALRDGRSGVRAVPEWAEVTGLETRLGAPVADLDLTAHRRRKVRAMGRVSLLAVHATAQAVAEAGLGPEALASGAVGLSYGSTHGSSVALLEFVRALLSNGLLGISSSSYLKFMSHTAAASLATFFGIKGRVLPTNAACVSGSLGIGYGYESIRFGRADVMICGGAEELHSVPVGVFDVMRATSTRYNTRPDLAPRPFDADRDGLVVGEGAGTVVLESLDHARGRGAPVHAEIVGFGTNCDGSHATSPSSAGMAAAMRLALEDAALRPDEIDYVNAHGTGTVVGDTVESRAMMEVLGGSVAASSTKGQTGHTLGASGAHELIFCLVMMREGFLAASRNLERVDPACARLDYVVGAAREMRPRTVMTNNFAFGGINSSMILRAM